MDFRLTAETSPGECACLAVSAKQRRGGFRLQPEGGGRRSPSKVYVSLAEA
jgi:hypothetical protein